MKKKLVSILLLGTMAATLFGCGKTQGNAPASSVTSSAAESTQSSDTLTYEQALEQAKGTTVTFYGWGGDDKLNSWIDGTLASDLKENYDITLDRVPMDIDGILSQLSGEKQAKTETGSIDMIWINGENFYTAKENGLLYGPFSQQLPNMESYVDLDDTETNYDFGTPIEGYEAPYSKAQLVFMTDTAKTDELPANAEEFLAFCKKYEGKVTYPALPDFTGSAFVRNIIYETCGGYEQFQTMEADKATVKAAIEPALEYLRSLNPYLWKQGTTFPASSDQVNTMFQDGELVFNVTYTAFGVGSGIADGIYPETTQAFQFDKGTIGNTNYVAIANNAPNKAGAIVAINEILSSKMQATKYEEVQYVPVTDYNKLSTEEKADFDKVDLGKGNIAQDELLSKRLPEMPASLVPIIEEIWLEEVVGK